MSSTADRALEHARVAGRRARMKGIPAVDAGVAFMNEGLVQIYGIERLQASQLVERLLPHAYDYLNRDIVEQLAASHGISFEDTQIMLMERPEQLAL